MKDAGRLSNSLLHVAHGVVGVVVDGAMTIVAKALPGKGSAEVADDIGDSIDCCGRLNPAPARQEIFVILVLFCK